MACVYTVNGVADELVTNIYQLIEDTNPQTRTPDDIEKFMLDAKVLTVVSDNPNLYVNPTRQKDALRKIDDINSIAVQNFGGNPASPLIITNRVGKSFTALVDYRVLRSLQKQVDDSYQFTTRINQDNPEPGEVGDNYTAEQIYMQGMNVNSEKVESVRKSGNELTEMIIIKLEAQLRQIRESQPTTGKKKNQEVEVRMREIRSLINKIKKKNETINDYYDLVHYLHDLSVRAESKLKTLEDNYETFQAQGKITNAGREAILNQISQLKQTIDLFYSNNSSRSVITLLGNQVNSMLAYGMTQEIAAGKDVLEYIRDTEQRMKNVDDKFLDSILPLHVDTLLQHTPIDINKELQAKIDRIKKDRVTVDINRFDKRFWTARLKGFDAVLELNIAQLQDKMIGRESILQELRYTHREAGWFSAWLDPIVYSKNTSIQLFAAAVKNKLFESYQASIDTKYDIADRYRKFVAYKGVGEDNVAKLYEDMYEEITIYINDPNNKGKFISKKVLAFVQEYDVNKFYEEKNKVYSAARTKYNYPETTDYKEKDLWFKSEDGKNYMRDINAWWSANTTPTPEAEQEISTLERALSDAELAIITYSGTESGLAELYRKRNVIESELRSVYSGGVIKGRLAVPNSRYKNPKFTSMPAEVREYYDYLMEMYKNDQLSKLGGTPQYKNSWDNFSYLLPSIAATATDKLYEQGFISSAKKLTSETFTFQETDTEFGELVSLNSERIKMVPMHFVGTLDSNLVSKDITNSILKFNDMANRFKSKSEIHGVVNIMRTALERRKVRVMLPTGDFATDMYAEKNGIGKLYETISPTNKGDLFQLNEWLESVFYDKQSVEDFTNNTILGISGTKVTSALTSFTALQALGLNVPQAVNQFIMDNVTAIQEGVAGGYFTAVSLGKAKMYIRSAVGNLSEYAAGTMTKNNKIGGLLEMTNAFQNYSENQITGTGAKKALNVNTLTFLQKAADIHMMGEKVLAMAFEYEGKLLDANGNVIKNKAGEDADLYDMIIQDSKGKWIIDPQVANVNLAQFAARVSAMSKSLNQLRGSVDVVAAQRRSIPKLLLLFRSYFIPGLRRRFGHLDGAHIDVESGELRNGYYNTLFNSIFNLIRTKDFSKSFSNLTKSEKQNIRRALMEFGFTMLAAIVGNAVKNMFDDDDEKNPYWAGFVTYQAFRLKTELSAFTNPYEFLRMAESPTATITPFKNIYQVWDVGSKTIAYELGVSPFEEDVLYQRKSGRYEKGDYKIVKEITDVLPIFSGVSKTLSPDEMAKFYEK